MEARELMLGANESGGLSMGYYCDGQWRNIMFTDKERVVPITHWLNMPEPPK